MFSSTHVLIGMAPSGEFNVSACESLQVASSDSLGILGFVLDCPPGLWTVSVWLTETGVDLPWWSEVVPWAVLNLPLWW